MGFLSSSTSKNKSYEYNTQRTNTDNRVIESAGSVSSSKTGDIRTGKNANVLIEATDQGAIDVGRELGIRGIALANESVNQTAKSYGDLLRFSGQNSDRALEAFSQAAAKQQATSARAIDTVAKASSSDSKAALEGVVKLFIIIAVVVGGVFMFGKS